MGGSSYLLLLTIHIYTPLYRHALRMQSDLRTLSPQTRRRHRHDDLFWRRALKRELLVHGWKLELLDSKVFVHMSLRRSDAASLRRCISFRPHSMLKQERSPGPGGHRHRCWTQRTNHARRCHDGSNNDVCPARQRYRSVGDLSGIWRSVRGHGRAYGPNGCHARCLVLEVVHAPNEER